jgi:hypothetical protein
VIERTEDEKKSLHLQRYKAWVNGVGASLAALQELQNQAVVVNDRLNYQLLEAREEISLLLESGVTQEQIDATAQLPNAPFDPELVLKQAKLHSATKTG